MSACASDLLCVARSSPRKQHKHARGKSCLYVNKLADIDLAVLEEMIRTDWEAMKRRYPD